LEKIGMESRRSTGEKLAAALALFGAGVLVGVGLGLMLAPKSGTELRGDIRERLERGGDDDKPVRSV
jgi:gas vesicle protein